MRAALALLMAFAATAHATKISEPPQKAQPTRRPSQGEVKLEPIRVAGALPQADVDRVVKARKGIYRACYQIELDRQPGLAGKLAVSLAIGADGIVTSVSAKRRHRLGTAVESCITSNLKRIKFPVRNDATTVAITMTFREAVITASL